MWMVRAIRQLPLPLLSIEDDEFAGIAGMDVSLQSIYRDLSSMKGRGYPFIMDGTGLIIFRPKDKPEGILQDLFEADNLFESTNLEC